MFRQIRSLLSESDMQLEGSSVEMDESYFGAKRKRGAKRGRPSPSDSNKQCVVGVVERGVGTGRVIATVATDATKATLHGIAKERILPVQARQRLDRLNVSQLRAVILHPAPDRGVVDVETTLLQQLPNITQ
jgi:hypothetical protein